MNYTKEFNKFFESFDTGRTNPEDIEALKLDMYQGWLGREEEVAQLNQKVSELEKELDELEDKYLNLKAQG